jgi:hypothetical protein
MGTPAMKNLLLLSVPVLLSLVACRASDNPPSTTSTTNAATTSPAKTTTAAPTPTPTASESKPAAREAAKPPKECIVLDREDANNDGLALTLEGTVVVDSAFAHPAQGVTKPFILKLAEKRCVTNGGDTKSADEVHLADPEGLAHLKTFVGKKVRVHGTPFHSHTAWHARDIVLGTSSVSPL